MPPFQFPPSPTLGDSSRDVVVTDHDMLLYMTELNVMMSAGRLSAADALPSRQLLVTDFRYLIMSPPLSGNPNLANYPGR